MNQLHDDVARTVIAGRLAAAEERRLVHQVKEARRLKRQAEANERGGGLWRRLFHGQADTSRKTDVAPDPATVVDELGIALDRVAQRVVAHGTLMEAWTLDAMAATASQANPGAAAALVDWEASEISRLRAFGTVHGILLRVLGPQAQAALLHRIQGHQPEVTQPDEAVSAAESAEPSGVHEQRSRSALVELARGSASVRLWSR